MSKIHRFRSTPTKQSATGTPTVSVTEAGTVIKGVSLFQAGVEALGHFGKGDEITLAQMVQAGNARPNGVKVRLGHPGMSEDGTGKQLARARNLSIQGDKVFADLHMLESARISPKFSGDAVDYVVSMAREAPEDFGMSVVMLADKVWVLSDGSELSFYDQEERPEDALNDMPIFRVEELRAADIVDDPAANRDGMFQALSKGYTTELAAEMFEQFDEWLADMGVTHKKAFEFAMRYFGHKGVNLSATTGSKFNQEQPDMEHEDLEATEVPEETLEQVVEDNQPEINPVVELAKSLQLPETFSAINDQLQAVFDTVAELSEVVTKQGEVIEALLDERTNTQRALSKQNAFPVLTESANLGYSNMFSNNRSLGVVAKQVEDAVEESQSEEPAPAPSNSLLDQLNRRIPAKRKANDAFQQNGHAGTALFQHVMGGNS